MTRVIFAIDDGQNPMVRNQFIQEMMAMGIHFRQLIGSFVMENEDGSGPAPVQEYSYSVSGSRFDDVPCHWYAEQESILVIDDGMGTLVMVDESQDALELGPWVKVSKAEAEVNDDWSFDIQRQEYWICRGVDPADEAWNVLADMLRKHIDAGDYEYLDDGEGELSEAVRNYKMIGQANA